MVALLGVLALSAVGFILLNRSEVSEKLAAADRPTAKVPPPTAAKPATPAKKPIEKKPPSVKSSPADADDLSRKPSQTAEAQQTADPHGPAASKPALDKPEETLGLVGDKPQTKLALTAAEPAKLALASTKPLAVVADPPTAIYAERTKPKTTQVLAQRGGTPESQTAVEDGLNWLARHQTEDGHWGADGLGARPDSCCEQAMPCEGPGEPFEAAHTGLALLAFQAAGQYYFNSQKYSDRVARGLQWLVDDQTPDGSIVGSQNPTPQAIDSGIATFQQYFMYEHAIATFALAEACAVAHAEGQEPEAHYREAAIRAVRLIERLQHADGGWRYTTNPREISDCSVSGWVMLALKTAREAKIKVDDMVVRRMTDFFWRHNAGARTYYFGASQQGTDAMTGVGMMAVEFFQPKAGRPLVTSGAVYLADRADGRGGQPVTTDYYLWYNCTMAMFQAGGKPWDRWNNALRDHVVGMQVHGETCERGSWPPSDQWSSRGGRIYSTALAVLTLEVYYRFQRLQAQPAAKK